MKTLIIPDVHENIDKLKSILEANEDCDKTIFLGDWFDKFHGDNSIETAKWVSKRMASHPQDEFLIGNHDLHYFSPIIAYRCSGFNKQRNINVNSILNSKKYRFKLVHSEGNVFFSHAGIVPHFQKEILNLYKYQHKILENAFKGTEINRYLEAGFSVGGSAAYAGVVWARPEDMHLQDKNAHLFNQVFGHTHFKEPKLWDLGKKKCVCLDTGLNSWATLEDKVLTIFNLDNNKTTEVILQ